MEDDLENLQNTMNGEEIVVTGMSGVFPNSDNVQEFMENLYNKVNMVSVDANSENTSFETPKHSGRVNVWGKFDAQFFKVGYLQAKVMDPMMRQILEQAYGAIFDSGNTQVSFKGKIIGVFVGCSSTDNTMFCLFGEHSSSDSKISGTSKSMMANRVSYWMDGKGPSYCIDYACVSSSAALEHAFNSIKAGNCDAAVVAGSNFIASSKFNLNLRRARLLCLDGKTKCFDKNGDGYVRSDAVSVIFLQKAKDAKRVYAEVCHVEGSYQLKEKQKFLHTRKSEDLQKFMKNIYSQTGMDPKDVEYVEANGAALAEADNTEVDAIANVFSGDEAVKIGSVKSNMGSSEAASGLCSLTKLCLAYHKGEIPASLHLEDPVQSAKDGKVKIVSENTSFSRGYTALNNFSYTGANYHVILKGHYKKKNLEKYVSNTPRIVLTSGRQESGVNRIFDSLKSKQVDAEEIALLHRVFENDIVGHMGRGYIIFDTIKESTVLSEAVDYYPGMKPPLWFVFSGMGSQWSAMGADLMRIPIFAAAIARCQKVLLPKGLDLVKIICDPGNKFDNILHSFVGIGAVQIGLTDILKELGVVPDYIIGHSLGENVCGYQDNTFTAEETMLAAYYRGKTIHETKFIKGAMAAVGLGYKTILRECPPEIDVGCHNSSESSTISGPAGIIAGYVSQLTKRGIFARTVQSSNISFHSRYIVDAGPTLCQYLKNVIKEPKPRSEKWISTSVPREQWDEPSAKYCSAEYHVNNLLNPVLFEETISLIPENAVVVEIAPHGLLQAILKRSLKNCTHIPLTRRGNTDAVKFLLDAIGKLYMSGFNPKVEMLYPKMEFPVSTETPLLSHLVEWEHSEDWPFSRGITSKRIVSPSRNIVFSLLDDDYKYLDGYMRNGVNILPEAALLAFVWETLAMYQEIDYQDLSVVFKNIQFHDEIVVSTEIPVRFTVMISKGNSTFEVTHANKVIVSGSVYNVKNLKHQNKVVDNVESSDEFETEVKLTAQDIYRVLRMRGLNCSKGFQSVLSSKLDYTNALIKWTGHWIPFLDSLIQLNTVSREYKGTSKPKFIRVLNINVPNQKNEVYEVIGDNQCYNAHISTTYGITRCAGVQIEDITFTDIPFEENTTDVLESQIFYPFYPTEKKDMNTAIEMSWQLITENCKSKYILLQKVVTGIIPEEFGHIDDVVNRFHLINTEIKTIDVEKDELVIRPENHEDNRTKVILMENVLQYSKKMKNLQNISEDTFILSLENIIPKIQSVKGIFSILSSMSDGKKILILMKKLTNIMKERCYIPIKFDDTFSWIPDVYSKLATTKRVVLISERQPYCGVLGLVKKMKATDHDNISVVIIDDFNAPKFDPDNEFYEDQLHKNMTINIMKKGEWGSFYYKSMEMLLKQKSFALKQLFPGNLENVSWVEAPKISGDKTLAQVCYSGLSVNDCHKMLDDNRNEVSALGRDFSGIDGDGEKVMGLIRGGSAASTVEADPDLLWPVPVHWSLEDAATVPLAYAQAYYCLTIRNQFRKESRVLICDGTSSVGLALISLCISYRCNVFTVVDSEDKKKTLLGVYPQLDGDNIICSDNESFASYFLLTNNGKKCDYVINFAAGPCREAASKCVAPFGLFIDFSKHDMYENKSIGMSFLTEGKSYIHDDVFNIFRPEFSKDRKVIQKLIQQGIDNAVVKPLLRKVFSPIQASKALEFLSQNQHVGKVLIRVRDPSIMSDGLETIPRISYSSQDVIIIVCDENGIGIELAERLIERGARKIVLHMKASFVTGYVHAKLLMWSKQEVSIKLFSDNLHTEKGSTTFMKNALKLGKITGVFVMFDTKRADDGKKEEFVYAFKRQSRVVMNLDVASRNCVDLSYFVIISRFTQSASDAYSLALTEKICDKRNEMGLQTLVMHYDSLAELNDISTSENTEAQPLSALFNAIETGIKLKLTNARTYKLKQKTNENVKEPEEDGMYSFYKRVNTEQDNVEAQAIVELPTLLNNGANDWDSDSYIILVPGFEGRPQIFETAAERLKIRSVAIQLGPDLEGESIKTIAMNARKELQLFTGDYKKDGEIDTNEKKFFIMGYSFGVNVALELAAILESEGKTGVVHCIDSSPDALKTMLKTILNNGSEDQLQNHILNHMCNIITGNKGNELKETLKNIPTFDGKVEECLQIMADVGKYTKQYKKLVLETAYKRIVMALEYKPDLKLKSQLVLMKTTNDMMAGPLSDDYNLSKYTKQPVKVFPLLARDPSTAPYDPRVSNIVNMFVDPQILKQFKAENLCNVYFTDVVG